MRISDWSSDVCSSDLSAGRIWPRRIHLRRRALQARDRELIFTSQGISMQTEQTTVNGIRITFEDKGPKEAPAILLVMGLGGRSEEHTSELQSLMRISYAVFCLKKKKIRNQQQISLQIEDD